MVIIKTVLLVEVALDAKGDSVVNMNAYQLNTPSMVNNTKCDINVAE